MKKFLFLIIALFTITVTVKAECLEKEYIDWAYDLKPVFTLFTFEKYEKQDPPIILDKDKYRYAYFLSLSKQRDDITFNVIDKYNNTLPAQNFEEIKLYGVGLYNGIDEETYKIEVYGNAKGKCDGELITTLSYTVPAYNEYFNTQYCDNYPDHDLCKMFTNDTQNMTLEEFNHEMALYERKANAGFLAKIWNSLKKIWVYVLCILIPVIGVSLYYNLKIKRYEKMRNRREIKRSKRKTYLLLLLLVLFTVRVNASGVCGDANMTEERITTADWATNLKICEWTGPVDSTKIGGGDSYDSAIAAGAELTYQTIMAADGKSASTIQVPLCEVSESGPGHVEVVVGHSFSYKKWECVENCDAEDENDKKYGWVPVQGGGSCDDPAVETEGEYSGGEACGGCAASYDKCSGDTLTYKYYAVCPIYACNPVKKVIEGWCTPTFKVNQDDDAYCINPSYLFYSGVNNYETQKFDPTKCVSSNSTRDCGFANILIESAYYNKKHGANSIKYQTTNMAMRLWAGEIGYGGFNKVGLAYVMGYDCNTYVAYPAGNPNVYKETLKYIIETYFEMLSTRTDYSVEGLISSGIFQNIPCSNGKLGLVCEGVRNSYIQAFALYFNTYFGNPDMHNHLADMFGDRTTEPTSATVTSEIVDQYSEIRVEYNEQITIGERIECKSIKDKKESGITLTEDEEKVLAYCSNTITHVIGVEEGTGRLIDIATGAELTDLNHDGKIDAKDMLLLPDPRPEDTYDFTYCEKSSCFSPVVWFATCDTINTEQTKFETVYTVIKYTKSKSKFSVKKYVACGTGEYQIMFSYDEDGNGTTTWYETTHEDKEPEKVVTVDFYCYDNTGCNNYQIRTESSCATKDGGYGKEIVKDPSLSCIVNMSSSTAKNSYDYSEHFGVNTDFCRVYCSDTAEFYLADKYKVYSGLSFNLNIEYEKFHENKSNRSLSSIVLMKRDCVSKIFYNNNKFESNTDWTKVYDGLTTNPTSWLELYQKLQKYGESDAHINQIKYDLYNCNFYPEDKIPVYRPKDNKIGSVYTRIKKMYKPSNAYGFNGSDYGFGLDAELNETAQNIVDVDIKYDGAAYEIGGTSRVGDEFNEIKISHEILNHNSQSEYDINVSKVRYCNGTDCFKYDESDEYKLPHEKSGNYTVSTAQGSGIPDHDYAYFSIVNEIDLYNDSVFQVEPYTGNIYNATGKTKDADYTDLAPYLYPVSKDAAAICENKDCNLSYRLKLNHTYYRKMGSGVGAFKEAFNRDGGLVHTCPVAYIPPVIELKNEAVYRNVDISNMFPTIKSDGTRRIGENWENSTAYVEEIESYVKANGAAKYYETHLEYSYTLTRDAINKIKNYNSKSAGYRSYTDNSITKGTCVGDETAKYQCQSGFITSINSNTNSYSISNNRKAQKRGVSEYTIEKEKD